LAINEGNYTYLISIQNGEKKVVTKLKTGLAKQIMFNDDCRYLVILLVRHLVTYNLSNKHVGIVRIPDKAVEMDVHGYLVAVGTKGGRLLLYELKRPNSGILPRIA